MNTDRISQNHGLGADRWLDGDEAREIGRSLRSAVPAAAHAAVHLSPERPEVSDYVRDSDRERLPELVALRHERMSASPFSLLRATAAMMAHDLATEPVTGLQAQLCGDAHVANFGLYGTDHGEIIMDINDFDETVVGPWEWDLKRLATSLVLAGREGGASEKSCAKAARHCAGAYRAAISRISELPFLQAWVTLGNEAAVSRARADALLDEFAKAAAKAARNDSARVAAKWVHGDSAGWHFVVDPPLLTPVSTQIRDGVIASLDAYASSLHHTRQHLLARYRACDVAQRVVGTGSVGLRCYLILLRGNGDEALVLQVKQASPSALAPYVDEVSWAHEGQRIVHGARLVQADSDLLLGWTTISEHQFIVRQFRNRKGAIDPSALPGGHLDDYGRLAGALLARAHTRSIDPRVLDGYCRDHDEFDRAISAHALAYAERVRLDHEALLSAMNDGLLETPTGERG